MESTHSKHGIFVIADDLGLDSAVNGGIFFALKNGLISGASLMANGEAFEDAIQKLKDFPGHSIGIHLVLVEEKPLTQIKLPKNHKIFFIKYILGLIKKGEIEKECEAQINKVLKASVKSEFINSHQHLHLLPGIMDIIISLAKKYGIPYVRIVNEPVFGKGKVFRRVQLLFLNFLSGFAKSKIKKAGLLYNDYFVGFINAGNFTREDMFKADKIKHANPDKIVELGCHPGFENETLRTNYSHWKYNWKKELELLDSFN